MELILIISFLSAPILILEFLFYLVTGKRFLNGASKGFFEILTLVLIPVIFLYGFDMTTRNDCCSESAIFSPDHRFSIYLLIIICLVAYFYSSLRDQMATPILEVAINSILVIAIGFNVLLSIHLNETSFFGIIGNLPIIILYLYRLIDNHKFLLKQFENLDRFGNSPFTNWILAFLRSRLIIKIPVFIVLALPILVFLTAILLLFGQKPSSLIEAFTKTYKHGLSELDCSNVTCPDGHFLCTIAASGHNGLVKPMRMGVRQNIKIKVNRQLLVSNAFEDLLAENFPNLHRVIRRFYNLIGGNCKRLYDVLGNKWISDGMYLLLKPLEWTFTLMLYLFDRYPEDRIAKQYLYGADRTIINTNLATGWQ